MIAVLLIYALAVGVGMIPCFPLLIYALTRKRRGRLLLWAGSGAALLSGAVLLLLLLMIAGTDTSALDPAGAIVFGTAFIAAGWLVVTVIFFVAVLVVGRYLVAKRNWARRTMMGLMGALTAASIGLACYHTARFLTGGDGRLDFWLLPLLSAVYVFVLSTGKVRGFCSR